MINKLKLFGLALPHIYSYLPYEAEYQGTNQTAEVWPGGDGAVVPMSDEALFSTYQWSTYLNFRTGDWGPTTPYFNIWRYQYTGIEQAGIFLEHVDECPDLSAEEKRQMKAEVRMLRAYSYFQLFRRYGPVYIWGDHRSNPVIKPDEVDRHTVDQNVDFMVSEIDKAIADLPLTLADICRTTNQGSGHGSQSPHPSLCRKSFVQWMRPV